MPDVAVPEPIEIDPLVPLVVVPDENDNAPLTPDVPAFALAIVIAPLDVAVPAPLVIVIAPPVWKSPMPPDNENAPPDDEP